MRHVIPEHEGCGKGMDVATSLAPVTGFEPVTLSLTGSCATGLRHTGPGKGRMPRFAVHTGPGA